MADLLRIFKDGALIESGIELRNGRATPNGWSSYEIWHVREEPADGDLVTSEERVGDLYCGFPKNFQAGWTYQVKPMETA